MKFANALFFLTAAASLGKALSSSGPMYCTRSDDFSANADGFKTNFIQEFNQGQEKLEEALKVPGNYAIGDSPEDGYFLRGYCELATIKGDVCVPDKEHPPYYQKLTLEDRRERLAGEAWTRTDFLPGKESPDGAHLGDDCEFITVESSSCMDFGGGAMLRMPGLPGETPQYYPGGPGKTLGMVLDMNCVEIPEDRASTICVGTQLDLYFKSDTIDKTFNQPRVNGYPASRPGDTVAEGKVLGDDCEIVYNDRGASSTGGKPTSYGDPHFKTWSGENYDFHGGCDLVLLQNYGFADGLGMNIHIRTKTRSSWSFIDSAVVQIGDNKLEVMGGTEGGSYWINHGEKIHLQTGDVSLGDFPVHFVRVNDHQSRARIDIGNGDAISIETFKDFVRVNIGNTSNKAFGGSVGLLGRYPDGVKLGRDGATVFEDPNEFGQEWMVKPSDAILFHDVDAGQLPLHCAMPDVDSKEARRRLGESAITEEEAAMACARVLEEDRDSCIFDVLATNDKDMAGSY